MDAKAEKIALFRYGLIAPLVLEALPRGELTRRAQEIAAGTTRFRTPNAPRSPSIRCWNGRSAIAMAASRRWRREHGRIGESCAPSPRSSPI